MYGLPVRVNRVPVREQQETNDCGNVSGFYGGLPKSRALMGRATSRTLQASRLGESPFFIRVCASESVPHSAISLVQRIQKRSRTTLGYGRVGTIVHVVAQEMPDHAGIFVGQRHRDQIPRLLLPQSGDPPPDGVRTA